MNWWLRDNVVRQMSAINGRHALAENLNCIWTEDAFGVIPIYLAKIRQPKNKQKKNVIL